MAGGSVYKRCRCGTTGTRGKPACKKPHGTWWWRAEATRDPGSGRRRQPSRGGYATKHDAAEGLAEFLAQRNTGRWRDDRQMTVGQWFERWLAEGDWEALTRATYEIHLATIWRPRVGWRRLRDLRRWQVEEVLREVQVDEDGRRRMPRTLRSYQATLRASLTAAMDAGLISENAAAGSLKAIPPARRPELVIWQPSELSLFLATTADDAFAPMWRVAAFTGLRRAELCGLRWCDVDLGADHPGVTIRQTLPALAGRHACAVCGGGHTGAFIKPTPKSDAGARWVPLVGEAVSALEAQRERQGKDRAAWGEEYGDHDLVFAREDGTPLNPSAVTKHFGVLVAGVRHPSDPSYRLPRIRPHDMRHGAASLMIAAGVPMETVSLILGHSSPAVTRQIYTHVLRGPAAAALEAAAALVRGSDSGAQSVHTPVSSSESEEVIPLLHSRSEASDAAVHPDVHCMTNPEDAVTDADGDCHESE